MKGSTGRLAVAVIGLGAIGLLAAWKFWPQKPKGSNGQDSKTDKKPASNSKGEVKEDKATSLKAFKDGLALYNGGKPLDARRKLSEAFFSGNLSAEQEKTLIPIMSELADKTLLQGNFYDGDPYVLRLTIEKGDTLVAMERKWKLHVPWQLLATINSLKASGLVREGQGLTVVQGPFHGIVRKSQFTIDIYLHRDGLPKVFVKRFRVGLGDEQHATPPGKWHVTKGGKQTKTPWYPPGSSPVRRKINWNEAGYPLGKEGYWIPLTGDDPTNRTTTGIGIHGTNDPTSIGKMQSLGCMRLLDDDIEWVFSMLYEEWSTVTVLP
jgi:lipoprotein-anchoring transpeptidase ErfK/SrfK